MIQSSSPSKEIAWTDPVQRSGFSLDSKSYEAVFSSLSISSNNKVGVRPPTLSSSSISSFGEEHNKSVQENGCVYEYSPPSSMASYNQQMSTTPSNSFPPPLAQTNEDFQHPNSFESFSYQRPYKKLDTSNTPSLHLTRYLSNGSSSTGGSVSDLNDLIDKNDDPSWAPQQRAYSTDPNRKINASTAGNGAFKTWSHNDIGGMSNFSSVDENRQFIDNSKNRHKAVSAGSAYGDRQLFAPINFRNGHVISHPPRMTSPQVYDQTHNEASIQQKGHMYHLHQNAIQENMVQSQPHHPRVLPNNRQNGAPRQRIMSADAVYGMDERTRNIMYKSNHDGCLYHHPLHVSGDVTQTRQRSFSSSASYGSNHHQFPVSNSFDSTYKITPETSYDQGPIFGTNLMMMRNMGNENEIGLGMNSIVTNNFPLRVSPPNGVSTHHYIQNNGLIANLNTKVIYTVKFKRSQRNFILNPLIQGDIKIGTYVKVEADRGQDLGIVLSRVPTEKFHPASRGSRFYNGSMTTHPNLSDMKKIIDIASNEEIASLQIKQEEEEELLKLCRSKALQKDLRMNVIDAEYQYDRHKLTFFFEAEGRVDFRELVRELFSIYKTRIWMQQIDKNVGLVSSQLTFSNPARIGTSSYNEMSGTAYLNSA